MQISTLLLKQHNNLENIINIKYDVYWRSNVIIIESLTPILFPIFAPIVNTININISEHGIKKYVFFGVISVSPLWYMLEAKCELIFPKAYFEHTIYKYKLKIKKL